MTWTKIDSATPDDPRILQLPRSVRWMHLEGLVWCNAHGTDGAIPGYALRRVTDEDDPPAAAEQLVAVGLWRATGDGWLIEDFTKDQPSRDDEERRQGLARERQRVRRQHLGGDHSLCKSTYCQQAASRVTNAVSNGGSHDTRPDRPDRPDRTEGTEGREGRRDGSGSDDGSLRSPVVSPSPSRVPSGLAGTPPGLLPPGVVPSVNGKEYPR